MAELLTVLVALAVWLLRTAERLRLDRLRREGTR